jgi:alpha-tubulin suppressor-like RCC1 family protein
MNLKFDKKVLFNKLNTYFYDNIRFLLKTPNKIFIITKNDVFYEINIYDENFPSFVLCDDNQVIESMIVKHLSGKNIIDLSHGFCHYIARNDRNEIFCWGNNSFGQLGNGKRDNKTISKDFINALRNKSENFMLSSLYGTQQSEPELNEILNGLNIVDVKCGFWHSLALSKNGDVYAWGLISSGAIIEEMSQPTPMKMDGFNGEKMVMISCGYKHSMALTESGRVFSWGENSYGQLGTENEIYREKPKLIEINDVSFKKISCGQRHSLLLSSDGSIYAFGDNSFGQIGIGNREMQNKPIKLINDKKIIDIASHFMEDISVSQSIDNQFYVWGKCGKQIHLIPFLTNCKSFDKVFSNFTYIQYKPSDGEFNDLLFRNGYFESEFTIIGKELGHGSFGYVFKVKDKTGNHFAIKKVKPIDGHEKDFRREYINHSRVTSLKSDYFVRKFDSWFENKKNNTELLLYIKMELCDSTLDHIMNEIHCEFYSEEDKILSSIGYYLACDIFIEILRGVLYLHQHKIIHRDLKPANILMRKQENGEISVKIADFGLLVLHEFTDQTHTQDKGTPKYIAPEVTSSSKYDTKADIYSLGIILENVFKIDPIK